MSEKNSKSEARRIPSYDPYTGKKVDIKAIALKNFQNSQDNTPMVICVLSYTGTKIRVPISVFNSWERWD